MRTKKSDALTFDATLSELERVVLDLEQGALPLEEALKEFERGVTLVRSAREKLEQAEQKIQILLNDGSDTLAPFTPEREV